MKRAKKKHLNRQAKKSWWRSLDGWTKEVMMRANSIAGKGIGKSRRKKKGE